MLFVQQLEQWQDGRWVAIAEGTDGDMLIEMQARLDSAKVEDNPKGPSMLMGLLRIGARRCS